MLKCTLSVTSRDASLNVTEVKRTKDASISRRSWSAKVSNSEAIIVRLNIAMIVEEMSRPLKVATAHMMRATCEVGM